MSSTLRADSVDPRESVVDRVYLHLVRGVLSEEADAATKEQRLWRLPQAAVHFVYGAVTDDERRRLEPTVHRLRMRLNATIDSLLDRSAAKARLAARVDAAREEVRLRSWRPDEAGTLRSLLDDPRVWAALPDRYPGVTETLASELISIANGWLARHVVQAVEWRDEAVGQVRLQFDSSLSPDSAEISYWLGERFWGRGLATHAVSAFTADSFTRWPMVNHIFANVLDHNPASLKVLEKCGYRSESFLYRNVTKDGETHSTHVVSVCRADYDFPQLAAVQRVKAMLCAALAGSASVERVLALVESVAA